jgi:hypothetical protein
MRWIDAAVMLPQCVFAVVQNWLDTFTCIVRVSPDSKLGTVLFNQLLSIRSCVGVMPYRAQSKCCGAAVRVTHHQSLDVPQPLKSI